MDSTNRKPRLLDLYCCQGGAAMGYHQAGFDVFGVDIQPQPRYPFPFHLGDAIEVLGNEEFMAGFDAIHASPPCQDHSALKSLHAAHGTGHLLEDTRAALQALGKPYVIENVVGAHMPGALILCGASFGLKATCEDGITRELRRHRLFESNLFLWGIPCACGGRMPVGVYGHGGGMSNVGLGQWQASAAVAREALDMPWADRKGLSQAIPPAYTRFIGEQLLAAL